MKKDAADVENLFMSEPNEEQDYFAFLGLKRDFALSLQDLEKQYIENQKKYHPDRYIHASIQDQKKAFVYTVLLNEAYETLKSPIKRGNYLLILYNETPLSSPSFDLLEGILERQERIFSLEKEKEIEKELRELSQDMDKLEYKVKEGFDKKDYDTVKMFLIELQYYEGMRQHLEQKLA